MCSGPIQSVDYAMDTTWWIRMNTIKVGNYVGNP